MLRELDTKLADYIEWLEDGIQRFGTNHARRYPKWGGQAKMSELEQQQQLDGFFKDNPELKPVNDMESMVCGAECGPGSMKGALGLLNALDEIITRRKARCEDIENKIDKLDDELFKEYLELEFFENKKRKQVQTTFDGFDV